MIHDDSWWFMMIHSLLCIIMHYYALLCMIIMIIHYQTPIEHLTTAFSNGPASLKTQGFDTHPSPSTLWFRSSSDSKFENTRYLLRPPDANWTPPYLLFEWPGAPLNKVLGDAPFNLHIAFPGEFRLKIRTNPLSILLMLTHGVPNHDPPSSMAATLLPPWRGDSYPFLC